MHQSEQTLSTLVLIKAKKSRPAGAGKENYHLHSNDWVSPNKLEFNRLTGICGRAHAMAILSCLTLC